MAALLPQLAKSDINDKWAKQAIRRLSKKRNDFMVGAFESNEIGKKVQCIREAKKIRISKRTSHMILEWKKKPGECLLL